jgi:hypothetical protein
MHLEAVRLIANALADGTIGVNALLDAVPRVVDRRPANVQVYDETRDGWVSLLELSKAPPEDVQLPALIVLLGGPIQWQYKGRPTRDAAGVINAPISVAVHYLTSESDTAVAVADALLTLRAVRGTLQLLTQGNFVAMRELNHVRLEGPVDMQQTRLFTPIEDTTLAGAVITTWQARETLPAYTP